MAKQKTKKTTPTHGSSGLRLTAVYFGAMIVLYVGERILFESAGWRLGIATVALLGIAFAIGARFKRGAAVSDHARDVERRIAGFYLLGLVALGIYFIQSDLVMDRLRPLFTEARSADRFAGVFAALWPVVWICAALPVALIEIAYAPMDLRRTVEFRRIQRSSRSGLLLAMSIGLVFTLNFISSELNETFDLSYFKTTKPSEASWKMVKNLSKPMTVTLFFPGDNEVLNRIQSYFDGLKGASKLLNVRVADHAIEPELAKKYQVTQNGAVVIAFDKTHQQIRMSTKLARAKRALKKLDSDFQTAFLKASRGQKIAYFTVGHDERGARDRDGLRGSSIRDLRILLTKLNFYVKDLGVGQGLASEVPKDANVLFIIGPKKPFLEGEIRAIAKFMRAGGRMLIMLDPEAGWDAKELLAPFGLKFAPVPLANDRYHARVTFTKADRQAIFSTRFSAHPSVQTLTRNAPRLAPVFFGAGALSEVPSTGDLKPQVRWTIHSMPLTWNDINKNHVYDQAEGEKRKIYELSAAVSLPTPKGKKKAEGPRLVVIGDSDLTSDKVFRHPGNGYLMLDTIRWLGGEEQYAGPMASEEDVRILHTRKEDQAFFYLTIFAVPALVLGGGLFFTRRRRKK